MTLPGISPTSAFPYWLMLVAGAALGWLRNFWNWIYDHSIGFLVRRISVAVIVEEFEHAEAWSWLQLWVEEKLRARHISSLMLRRQRSWHNHDANQPVAEVTGAADIDTADIGVRDQHPYEIVPAYGVYPFIWKRHLIIFSSEKEDKPQSGNSNQMFAVARKAKLEIFGTQDRQILLQVISEARQAWEASHPEALRYFSHRYSYWNSKPLAPRHRETVYLPAGMLDEVLADARMFLKTRDRYESMGIPWRTGYLFFGPPGTGKTTLVQCLATELKLSLYYLGLASVRNREDLSSLLDSVEPRSIVLIEDVDCISAAAERMSNADDDEEDDAPTTAAVKNKAGTGTITPSDLLNFIDGIVASQGRILIMTTNYPENLDRALIRPGRIDRKWHIDYAKREELEAFHRASVRVGMCSLPIDEFKSLLPCPATIADAQMVMFTERRKVFELEEADG